MNMIYENDICNNGISGLMRVSNEEATLQASIESCIHALDELIIVYNDCTDDSPFIIESLRKQYSDKIKVYPYSHNIVRLLTESDYDEIKNAKEDDPRLLANYYNFALSKVNFKYVVKIDADQIYLKERFFYFCDLVRGNFNQNRYKIKLGCSILYGYKNINESHTFWEKVDAFCWRVKAVLCKKYYHNVIFSQLRSGKACISLSGINVVKYEGKWFCTLGYEKGIIRVLPPYNGTHDHLIFEATKETYYVPYLLPVNNNTHIRYNLIERFIHPHKDIYDAGFAWLHFSLMKDVFFNRNIEYIKKNPSVLIDIVTLSKLSYISLLKKCDKNIADCCLQKIYGFVHDLDRNILKHIKIPNVY